MRNLLSFLDSWGLGGRHEYSKANKLVARISRADDSGKLFCFLVFDLFVCPTNSRRYVCVNMELEKNYRRK